MDITNDHFLKDEMNVNVKANTQTLAHILVYTQCIYLKEYEVAWLMRDFVKCESVNCVIYYYFDKLNILKIYNVLLNY